MTELLGTLIDESQSMPPKVVDVIMAQFLRAAPPSAGRGAAVTETDESQTTLLLKEEPEAYQMAKAICNTYSDKMARLVAQYFSDVIMDFSGTGARANGTKDDDSDEEGVLLGPTEADLREMRKAHSLLRELWRAAPQALQNVVPQLDAELSADNVHLRQLATETLGDMISGIGVAGPPPHPTMDPAAYPPPRLSDETSDIVANPLRKPSSPQSFAQSHPTAYSNFVSRKNDKSNVIRAAWVTAVGYIISTSAGGVGLSRDEEAALVKGLGEKLGDSDEKVRLAAVKAIEAFSFKDVMAKLAPSGGIEKDGSVLHNLSDRCRDKRSHVRIEAMVLMGKLWAAATGELAAGDETVKAALGAIPSRIVNSFYANDIELNVLLDRVIYEYLVPMSYPPAPKKGKNTNGHSQSQAPADPAVDADAIRAERIILLFRSLDENAKKAFFAMQTRQPQFATVVDTYLKQCEAWNGGLDEDKVANLDRAIGYLSQFFPDPVKLKSDLHKFAKLNDRRNYQLIRYVTGREHDFKTMHRALKELIKRLEGSNAGILDSLVPLLYRSGCILYNRSHLSTILDKSRSTSGDISAAAHEILNDISQHNPILFKTHVSELCKDLAKQAPSANKPNDPIMAETLKACASYASKYPQEVPLDRNFNQTLMSYAVYGTPPKAAKYAVNVLLARKDHKSKVSATELLQKVMKHWKYDSPHFLNCLTTVSQLQLLAPDVTSDSEDEIVNLIRDILKNVRTDAKDNDPSWVEEADLDKECQAKILCLKYLVKKQAPGDTPEETKQEAKKTLTILNKCVASDGEMCKTKDTPKFHKSRLQLVAAQSILKVCTQKDCDDALGPAEFNRLAFVAQAETSQVRHIFVGKLQKHLVQGKLRPRFYTIMFLTAFEPDSGFKQRIETWIRSRVHHFEDTRQGDKATVMDSTMARLLSLLAHHPDYSSEEDDLVDHAKYLLYYVSNVTTESNLGIIYKYAERVKQTLDAIDKDKSEHLYVLADLAQAVIRKWQEKRNWTFEAYPGKVGLPMGLYLPLPSHDAAQAIAEKQYIPDGIDDKLDDIIKQVDRKKVCLISLSNLKLVRNWIECSPSIILQKRKSMDERFEPSAKRAKSAPRPAQPKAPKAPSARKVAKAKIPSRPKKPARPSSPVDDASRRRSGRARGAANASYMERDSDQDDEDMLEGVAEWDYFDKNDRPVQAPKPAKTAKDDSDEEEVDSEDDAMEVDEQEKVAEPAADDKDSDSALSEPAEDEDAEDEAEEEEDEEEPAPKANGRRGRAASAKAPAKGKANAAPAKGKAAAKAVPAPAPAATTSGRATRARRGA